MSVQDYVVESLHNGSLRFAAEQPDNPQNFPRNMFIWRSNLLGSSGKGHEYMLKYLLGTKNGLLGDETVQTGFKPNEIDFVENAPTGKIDLVTTLDFRMSSTCLYSDIVLPTATWYEKEDINTSDMHPFIHPFTAATDPAWKQKLTGRFINTSLRHSLAFVLGIWEHKPMWLPYPCNMTVPMNWLNPLVAQIGKVQVKNPYPALIAHSSKLWNEIIPAPMPSSLLLVL